MYVVGIDYSMTCPAITIAKAKNCFTFETVHCFYLSGRLPNTSLSNVHSSRLTEYSSTEMRWDAISEWVLDSIYKVVGSHFGSMNTTVFIEGYAMGASGRVFEIAENTAILKHKLWFRGIPINIVPPTVVKKFATTKGNATKPMMYEWFLKDTGVPLMSLYQPKAAIVGSPVGDIVDSYYICSYGWTQLGLNTDR
jgi:hypothetical protein